MKLTFISDTHNQEPHLPGGDILFHCGDLTIHGYRSEIFKQLNYLHEQLDKYKHIVLIPGNHDYYAERHLEKFKEDVFAAGLVPLIHEGIEIENIKIWGSPATPAYHDWAFNFKYPEIKNLWSRIPEDVNILLTHGPAYGILDKTLKGNPYAGCVDLLERLDEISPKIHAFGHIHEAAGYITGAKNLLSINAATAVVQVDYNQGSPVVVDFKK